IRALQYSTEAALEEPEAPGSDQKTEKKAQLSNWFLALNLAFSLGFFLLFYKLLPLYLATLLKSHWALAENLIVFNLVDGTIRIALFLGFLTLLAQWKDM